jgi:vacuolar-type H+-ATPase subunit E/Vma4
MSEERLSRMEDKLDKLSEAVVEMARMEERLLTVFKRLEHMDAAFKKYDDRVDEIEKQALIRGQKIAFAEPIATLGAALRLGWGELRAGKEL